MFTHCNTELAALKCYYDENLCVLFQLKSTLHVMVIGAAKNQRATCYVGLGYNRMKTTKNRSAITQFAKTQPTSEWNAVLRVVCGRDVIAIWREMHLERTQKACENIEA